MERRAATLVAATPEGRPRGIRVAEPRAINDLAQVFMHKTSTCISVRPFRAQSKTKVVEWDFPERAH